MGRILQFLLTGQWGTVQYWAIRKNGVWTKATLLHAPKREYTSDHERHVGPFANEYACVEYCDRENHFHDVKNYTPYLD